MTKLKYLVILPLLAGCVGAGMSDGMGSDLRSQLSGKTLTHPNLVAVLSPDGIMTGTETDGTPFGGTWTVREGRFCRTLDAPSRFAGTACQSVEITGDQATFTRDNGSSFTYTIS